MADETPGEGGQASTAVHGFAPGTVLEGKSDAHVKIRVQAPGYEPRVLQVQPTRTRRVKIELDRTPRKRKKTK